MFSCFKSLAAAFALGGVLFPSPAVAAGKPVELAFMGCYVEEHPAVASVWKPFFKAAEEAFAGQIAFRYFSENMLYSNQAEAAQGISDGRAAFGCIRPSVHPDIYRLLGVINVPGLVPNAVVGSLVLEDIIAKFPAVRAELPKNSTHFTSWTSAAYQIGTVEPVHTLAELKGRKIIVWDAVSHALVRELGAEPVRVSPADSYWTFKRGLADGILCPLPPLRAYKLTEMVKHHLLLDAMVQGFVEEVNLKQWEAMPKDMKAWFRTEGGSRMALALGRALENGVKADRAAMEAAGHAFCSVAEVDRPAFKSALDTVTGRWKEHCRELDPKLVDAVLSYARERAAYHSAAFEAGKYER